MVFEFPRMKFYGDVVKTYLQTFLTNHIRADQTELMTELVELKVYPLNEEVYDARRVMLRRKQPAVAEFEKLSTYTPYMTAWRAARIAREANDRITYNFIRDNYRATESLDLGYLIDSLFDDFYYSFSHFYLVTPKLAESLAAAGEPVINYLGSSWWASDTPAADSEIIKKLAQEAAGYVVAATSTSEDDTESSPEEQLELPFVEFKTKPKTVVSTAEDTAATEEFVPFTPVRRLK